MKTSKKIAIAVAAVIGLAVVGAGAYWFSIPKEMRNMMLFMVTSGESYDDYEEYQVIERNEFELEPTSFESFAAVSEDGNNNVNIKTVSEMVLNEESGMLKKGMVQTEGVEDYTGWQLLADEGADDGEYPFGPSPLSYYTSGLAANLHTQVLKAAEVKGVELDNVTVEVMNTFYWVDMSSEEGQGNLGVSTTNIMIESDASEALIQEITEMALNSWAAGQGLMNEVVVEPHLIVNGNSFEVYNATPGTSNSEVSYDGDVQLSSVTEEPVYPEYIELAVVDDGFSLDAINNMSFEIYAISTSVDNDERPYLNEITLSTPSGETWVIYADEFMSEDDTPVAPTSLEYFTLGTTLCLTSQTTLVSAMLDLDYEDYRVEHLFEYYQTDINTEDMSAGISKIHTYVIIESDEDLETLEEFYARALALCFAGEGLTQETEMAITTYLNGVVVD